MGEPVGRAYLLCHVPAGRPCSFTTLVRVAGRRWPVEEDFRLGKSDFGLADSQVRLTFFIFLDDFSSFSLAVPFPSSPDGAREWESCGSSVTFPPACEGRVREPQHDVRLPAN
jgi:hypothetical protein